MIVERIDRRVLAAVRFADAASGLAVTQPLGVSAPRSRWLRNRSGLYVLAELDSLVALADAFVHPAPQEHCRPRWTWRSRCAMRRGATSTASFTLRGAAPGDGAGAAAGGFAVRSRDRGHVSGARVRRRLQLGGAAGIGGAQRRPRPGHRRRGTARGGERGSAATRGGRERRPRRGPGGGARRAHHDLGRQRRTGHGDRDRRHGRGRPRPGGRRPARPRSGPGQRRGDAQEPERGTSARGARKS
ncbi:MAG: hypothetical protein M0C28_32740 [Candidatus Moduliflexus flocculans]|nr:hypothetical protein [Candidatus Moduliflexus flocculans]